MSNCRSARGVLLLGLLALLLLVPAGPALAHGRGSDASNYDSRLVDTPAVEGLAWRVYGGDELLWVDNTTDEELVVFGYERGPRDVYLRIGPDGVFENRNSEATYVNRERLGRVPVPESVDPAAPPDWVKVSDDPRYAWHDHRIHYMGLGMHPRVSDPGEHVLVMDWTVPVTVGGAEYEVAGELHWVPGPSAWPWLALGLALTLPALAGLRTAPVNGRWPGLARPAAAVLGAAVVASTAFAVDDLFALPLPIASNGLAALQTVLFLAVGAFGAIRGWQGGDGAFTALGVGAAALLVGQGMLLWPVLGASQLTTVFPDVVPRALVGVNIMLALPLGVVALVGTRRLLPDLGGARDA